jgi:hypothetical protein
MPAVPLGVAVAATRVAGIAVALGAAVAAAVGAMVVGVAAAGVRRSATCVAMLLSAPAGDVAPPVAAVVGVVPGVLVAAVPPPHAARMADVAPAAIPPKNARRLSIVLMMSLLRIPYSLI